MSAPGVGLFVSWARSDGRATHAAAHRPQPSRLPPRSSLARASWRHRANVSRSIQGPTLYPSWASRRHLATCLHGRPHRKTGGCPMGCRRALIIRVTAGDEASPSSYLRRRRLHPRIRQPTNVVVVVANPVSLISAWCAALSTCRTFFHNVTSYVRFPRQLVTFYCRSAIAIRGLRTKRGGKKSAQISDNAQYISTTCENNM